MMIEITNDIKRGKIAIFKTNTVYGMYTNALDETACQRIYEIKDRPRAKPLCVLISDISTLEKIVDFIGPIEQKLIEAFWPGYLTILFKIKESTLPNIVSETGIVEFRLLKDGLSYNIIKRANVL